MIVVTNAPLAARRRRQAALLSLAGLGVLLFGLAANVMGLRGPVPTQVLVLTSYGALVLGSVLSWLGMGLADRWTMPPRPEDALEAALHGSGRGYRLYNWALPADHVLLAPWGLAVLRPMPGEGPVAVSGDRWQDLRPIVRRLVAFGRRPMRHPGRLLEMELDALRSALASRDPELADVPIEGIAVLTHPAVNARIESPTLPVVRAAELRDHLRAERGSNLSPGPRRRLERALETMAQERLAADRPKPRRKRK